MALSILRDARWLTAARVAAVTRILLVFVIALAVSMNWTVPDMQVGHDFGPLWAAARLVLGGHPADVYGEPVRAATAALLGPKSHWPFAYPPTALLLWLPFGLVSFAAAVAIWLGGTAIAYGAAMRALLDRRAIVPALAFPAVAICALYGQNGLFSAALFAAAAALLGPRPVLAGIVIGCLAFKPQLAVLAPLALIVAGRWRAVAGAAVTLAALVGVSAAAFGTASWTGFFAVMGEVQGLNARGESGFDKFVGLYPAARVLGASEAMAWIVAGLGAAAAVVLLVAALRRRPGPVGEIALLVAATGLCVPFLGEYDLVILAVPGVWLVSEALRAGWLPYERVGLALLFALPLVIRTAAMDGIPLGPVALALMALLVLRRVFAAPGDRGTA
jgi:hypothetical protein